MVLKSQGLHVDIEYLLLFLMRLNSFVCSVHMLVVFVFIKQFCSGVKR